MEQFRVPGYELGQLLTAGATGEFWLARSQATGEQVALRRFRLPSPDKADQLRRLVTLVSMIDHPHLLAYRESVPVGAEFALVMEHPDGGNLDQLLSGRGNLDPGEVVTTIGPIAEALAAAHERDLVHGDIHPESIWYMSDGRPLLADIGLFALSDGAEAPRMHTYADPAAPEPTPAGDVYALAAVCHTAITGIVPNPGQQRPSLQDSGAQVPNGLVHAVEAGLAEAERRPSAADFTELIYSAYPAAPVRFPVGLALSDADIAAALAQADIASPPTPPPGSEAPPGAPGQSLEYQPGQPMAPDQPMGPGQPMAPDQPMGPGQPGAPGQPVQPGQPLPGGQPGQPQPGQPGPPGGQPDPVDPFALAASGIHQPNMFGPTPDVVEEEEEEPGPRLGLWIAVAVAAVVLLGGGILGVWYFQQGGDGPPAAGGEQDPGDSADSGGGEGTDTQDGSGGQQSGNDPDQGGDGGDTGGGAPTDETPEETAWRERLEELDKVRAEAFAKPDPTMFDQVYAPNATDLKDGDRSQLESTQCGGCRLEGVRFEIKQIDVVKTTGNSAVLRVTDQRQPYTVVLSSGEEIPQGAGPDQRREFTLGRIDGEWRIAKIDNL